MNEHEKINYVEFPARDLAAVKSFSTTAFGWSFTDYVLEFQHIRDVCATKGLCQINPNRST